MDDRGDLTDFRRVEKCVCGKEGKTDFNKYQKYLETRALARPPGQETVSSPQELNWTGWGFHVVYNKQCHCVCFFNLKNSTSFQHMTHVSQKLSMSDKHAINKVNINTHFSDLFILFPLLLSAQ